eukprot:470333_1
MASNDIFFISSDTNRAGCHVITERPAKRRKLNHGHDEKEYKQYLQYLEQLISLSMRNHKVWKEHFFNHWKQSFPREDTLKEYQTVIENALLYRYKSSSYREIKRAILTMHGAFPKQYQRLVMEMDALDDSRVQIFNKYFTKKPLFDRKLKTLTHVPHLLSSASIFNKMMDDKQKSNEREIIVLSDDDEDDDLQLEEEPPNMFEIQPNTLPVLEFVECKTDLNSIDSTHSTTSESMTVDNNETLNPTPTTRPRDPRHRTTDSHIKPIIQNKTHVIHHIPQPTLRHHAPYPTLIHSNITSTDQLSNVMSENHILKKKCTQYENEIKELQKQLKSKASATQTLKNVLSSVNKKNIDLEQKLKTVSIEKNQLQIISSSLQAQLIKGHEPRRQFITSTKSKDGIERTRTVQKWKDDLNARYKNILISQHEQPITAAIGVNIDTFLKLNINDKDYRNPIATFNEMKLSDMVEQFTIQAPHRVPQLIGQEGVRCTVDTIPKGVVLARYVGFEMTNSQWNDTFDYSNKDGIHGQYLYSFNVDLFEHEDGEERCVTIDPIEGHKEFIGIYINDGRKDIYCEELSASDKKHINCTFFVARIYGWPTVFLIATKQIIKGEELLLDYGKNFWYSIKQNNRWNGIIQKVRQLAQQNIIKNTSLCDTHNGVESHDLTL